ncbi:hypothetical protein B0H17DRAFT_494677 [Mycena rosella]|uniref:Uncharacterized protein n=1 Tax=Mycena rosella TaxID=1033263 RepID=A0AAD7FQI5_MYCRO|nr:hypothetical protein B0H17DRAFT_494677 [Mycena rosella]
MRLERCGKPQSSSAASRIGCHLIPPFTPSSPCTPPTFVALRPRSFTPRRLAAMPSIIPSTARSNRGSSAELQKLLLCLGAVAAVVFTSFGLVKLLALVPPWRGASSASYRHPGGGCATRPLAPFHRTLQIPGRRCRREHIVGCIPPEISAAGLSHWLDQVHEDVAAPAAHQLAAHLRDAAPPPGRPRPPRPSPLRNMISASGSESTIPVKVGSQKALNHTRLRIIRPNTLLPCSAPHKGRLHLSAHSLKEVPARSRPTISAVLPKPSSVRTPARSP